MSESFDGDRSLWPWWALVIGLTLILLSVMRMFLGTIVFAVFLYYAVRPINHRIRQYTSARRFAARLTMVLVLIPLLLLLLYIVSILVNNINMLLTDQVRRAIQPYVNVQRLSGLTNLFDTSGDLTAFVNRLRQLGPLQTAISIGMDVLLMIFNFLIHLSLVVAIVYYLLRDGPRIDGWLRKEFGKRSATYAYARSVDADLESVYFGNVIAIAVITIVSVIWFNIYNMIAPSSVAIPVPTLLAVLTGLASIIPVVVGKLVWVPLSGYLVLIAYQTNTDLLQYPALFVAVAFIFIDFIPQTFIQPFIAGRNTHMGLMVFAYTFGGLFFGWYGLFLGPIILVLALEAVRFVVTDLLHGGPVTARATAAVDLGSDPPLDRE